jgi:polyisoprenoid-binding protein YceI
MTARLRLALLLLALPLTAQAQDAAPAAPAGGPVSYALAGGTALHVRVYKDPSTVAAGLSHDHAIASTQHSGTVSYDPANPAACAISVTVPVAGLDPDPDALRQKVGLPGVIEASARAEIKEHMLDAEQLNAKAFPTITFVSTSCAASGDQVKVSGTLTIRGKAQPVSLNMKVKADAAGFSASGSLPIKATQFGFQPFSALLGALKNKDEMTLVVNLAGKPR